MSSLPSLLSGPRKRLAFGAVSLSICLVAWVIDWMGLIYQCPYCKMERSIVGLLGVLFFVTPVIPCYLRRYLAVVLGGFGFVVSANQHFLFGWMPLMQGKFSMTVPWYFNSMLLSGLAILIIAAQTMILSHTDYA